MAYKPKHINEVAIVKGIGIVLMVVGHTAFKHSQYIYLFHMAVFFIAAGFLYNDDCGKDIGSCINFIINKVNRLWLPYFLYNSVYVLLNNVFVKFHIYTSDEKVLALASNSMRLHNSISLKDMIFGIVRVATFRGAPQMGGATWFLKTMFLVMVFFLCMYYLIGRGLSIPALGRCIANVGSGGGIAVQAYSPWGRGNFFSDAGIS